MTREMTPGGKGDAFRWLNGICLDILNHAAFVLLPGFAFAP